MRQERKSTCWNLIAFSYLIFFAALFIHPSAHTPGILWLEMRKMRHAKFIKFLAFSPQKPQDKKIIHCSVFLSLSASLLLENLLTSVIVIVKKAVCFHLNLLISSIARTLLFFVVVNNKIESGILYSNPSLPSI